VTGGKVSEDGRAHKKKSSPEKPRNAWKRASKVGKRHGGGKTAEPTQKKKALGKKTRPGMPGGEGVESSKLTGGVARNTKKKKGKGNQRFGAYTERKKKGKKKKNPGPGIIDGKSALSGG